MKLTIFTDAWEPQINGVVSTLKNTIRVMQTLGWEIKVVHPGLFKLTVPLQPSTGIYMPLLPMGVVDEEIQNADKIHIATEGAIGLAARHSCKKYKKKYITSFHTQYPDYLYEHAYIPPRITGRYFRWFHRNSSAVLVPTPAMVDYCKKYGIQKLKLWSRGVDTNLFKPDPNFKRQGEAIRAVYVGRVSVEKNLEEFLKINNPQIVKYIIGDGPQLEEYKAKYSDAFFLGKKTQQEIASILQTMDVFAWPSLTDTFGLVVLEAMASGLPVAAFRNEVNEFIITEKSGELMTWDLEEGILSAFKTLKKEDAIARAKEFSWETATQQFISHLV